MRPFMLHGKTIEEKLASAETALRQMRNLAMPQKVIMEYANSGFGGHTPLLDADNVIKMLVPISGNLTNVCIYCGSITPKVGKKEAVIRIDVEITNNLYESKSALVKEGRSSSMGDKAVIAGMRMIISSDVPIADFWYSFEIEPNPRTKVVVNPQTLLIEENV